MAEWIQNLLALQDLDMRIRRMKMRLQLLPKERSNLEAEITKAREDLKQKSETVKKTELTIKQVEDSIAKVNGEIAKLQNQSAMVKKNDEYKALLSEINNRHEQISELETKEITLLDDIETARTKFKEFEKQFEARKQTIEEDLKELSELGKELKEEIVQTTSGRTAYESKIESAVINIYNRLLKTKGSPMVKIHNGNCGNCHLKITPQTFNEAKKSAIAICDHCSHMLYIENQVK
jgi:predicted  nucleic acid-binding Zn-ribbon protein